jgi:hypothetical protein
MKGASAIRLVAIATVWLCLSGVAGAQQSCPAGVAANGQCVDATVVDAMREGAIIFSQPQISYTAFPILPTGDTDYRYPHQLNPDQSKPSPVGTLLPPPLPP